MARYEMRTTRGYKLMEVVSALQKAIRRADGKLAGYWAIEMFESNFGEYCWRRLLTISAEDCAGLITREIESLYNSYTFLRKKKKKGGRIFIAKAALLLSAVDKNRDPDHLTNFIYDKKVGIEDAKLLLWLDEARDNPEKIPEYSFDCHTKAGKMKGKTKANFFREEFEALKPRQKGLFDDVIV